MRTRRGPHYLTEPETHQRFIKYLLHMEKLFGRCPYSVVLNAGFETKVTGDLHNPGCDMLGHQTFIQYLLGPFRVRDHARCWGTFPGPGSRSWAVLLIIPGMHHGPSPQRIRFQLGPPTEKLLVFPKGMNGLHKALNHPTPGAHTDCPKDTLPETTQMKHRVILVKTSQADGQHLCRADWKQSIGFCLEL